MSECKYIADGYETMLNELKEENQKLKEALKVAVEALEFYKSYSDCAEGCRSRSDSWVLKCTCGFIAKEKEHRQALSKIKALRIVKEGE